MGSGPGINHTARRRRWRSVLLAILVLAAGLRLVRLDSLPPALFRDEAEKALTAYSLATRLTDLQGNTLPVFIEVMGVTTSAIYQYAAVPFMGLLGLNEWSARLPAALVGIATVALVWVLVRRERGREAAAWAALFLALSSWHIVFSRWAQQGIFLPLLLTATLLGWNGFARGRRWGLPVAGIFAALAMYAYDPARAFVPLLGAWAIFLYLRELIRRWPEALAGAAAFLIAASPLLTLFATNSAAAQARFDRISIFGGSPSPIAILTRFLGNYGAHWSPDFLLLNGDRELRHGAGVGVLTAVETACLVAGVIALLRRRRKQDLLWLGWLLAWPVAASLTREGIPHALRSIVALPGLQVIAGIGAAALVRLAWRRLRIRPSVVRTILAAGAVLSAVPFVRSYFGAYADRSAISWQYGIKQALEILSPEAGIPPDVPIFFAYLHGAEYLVPFYTGVLPADLSKADPARPSSGQCFTPAGALGQARYRLVYHDCPPDTAFARMSDEPAAFVTLPMIPGPPGGRTIPIRPPSGNAFQTAAMVYLNEPLVNLLIAKGVLK